MLRLAYLGVSNALALLRLVPMSERGKDIEILALRHQIMVLERQLGTRSPIQNRSPASTYDDVTASAASSTNADVPPDQDGRGIRQAHLHEYTHTA